MYRYVQRPTDGSVAENMVATWPKCLILERVLPINNVCVANKERIKEVLSNLIDVKFPKLNEPSEYYIMPRVRFHPSIERDHLLEIARETMKEKRPECQACFNPAIFKDSPDRIDSHYPYPLISPDSIRRSLSFTLRL